MHSKSRIRIMNATCCGIAHEASANVIESGKIIFHIKSARITLKNVVAFSKAKDPRLPTDDDEAS